MIILEMDILDGEDDGIFAMSIVDEPAIEVDFVKLSEEKKKIEVKLANANDEKQLLTGPALIPNKYIYRPKEELDGINDGYIVYPEKVVEKGAYKFCSSPKPKVFNLNHNGKTITGVRMVESWMVSNPEMDKSKDLGLTDITKGTWMITCKVDDIKLWNTLKEGNFNGFSLEGNFVGTVTTKMSKQEKEETLDDWLEEVL